MRYLIILKETCDAAISPSSSFARLTYAHKLNGEGAVVLCSSQRLENIQQAPCLHYCLSFLSGEIYIRPVGSPLLHIMQVYAARAPHQGELMAHLSAAMRRGVVQCPTDPIYIYCSHACAGADSQTASNVCITFCGDALCNTSMSCVHSPWSYSCTRICSRNVVTQELTTVLG